MIRYIEKGDIFRIDGVSSYAHGCNCAGAMGKGIAVQFKSKYPDMYLEYKQLCKENKFCPGDVFDYDYGNGHIYNLGTQATWRTRAKIEYIEKALIQMLELASGDNVTAIALPAIGAGLGGLKWDDVSRKETVKSCCVNILDDVKRILAQPFECRKTSLPDGALHNVQKELENMINAIDKDIYSFTPSYGKYLIDCWLGDELVDKLLDVSCQYEKLIKLK